MSKPKGLICTRLADMTVMHPLQVERQCDQCGTAVGVYPSGQAILVRYPNLKITCSVCTPPWGHNVRSAGTISEIIKEKNESLPAGKA